MFASTRFLQRFGAFGFLVVVGTSAPSDTTRRVYGYGGVLPVPPAVDVDDAGIQLPDILGQRRPTLRSEKGRVLYANERVSTPAGSDAHVTSSSRAKRPCSQLVQTRATGAPDS
jgi:hypothetical protein